MILNSDKLKVCGIVEGVPSSIMKKLGLKLSTKCFYKMILNSDKLKVCGIVEGVKTFLHIYPKKRLSINIVVVETPPTWGMIMSQKLIEDLNLSINEDGSIIYLPWKENSYASIPKHELSAPMIALSQEDESNIKEESDNIGEWRLFKDERVATPPHPRLWVMYFDGAHSKSGSGVDIVIISPYKDTFCFH